MAQRIGCLGSAWRLEICRHTRHDLLHFKVMFRRLDLDAPDDIHGRHDPAHSAR